MKLIEVVVLMGAQCISPVQHSQAVTEAAKVECAVVVEKDTDAGSVKVLPPSEANNPKVVAVLQRFKTENIAARMRIEPTSAPPAPQQISTPRKPLELAAPIAPPETADTAEADAIADPANPVTTADAAESDAVEAAPEKPVKSEATKASDAKPSPKAKVAKGPQKQQQKTAQKPASECAAGAVQKWYTASDGHKKYRCVRPGKEADARPAASKLY